MNASSSTAMHGCTVSEMVLLGFMLVLVLGGVRGQMDQATSQKVDAPVNRKTYLSLIPGPAQSQTEPGVDKRMDLMSYFFNGGLNNQAQQEAEPSQPRQVLVQDQQSGAQVQVQQPNPNQLIVTRENDFLGGSRRGIISRLMMARRTARLRRLSNMIRILPSLLRLMGQIQIPGARTQQEDQLSLLFNNRDGLVYNPADIMKRPPLYANEQTLEQPKKQNKQKEEEEQKQQTRGHYYVEEDPRFDSQDTPTQNLKELQLGKYGPEDQKFNDFDDQPGKLYGSNKQQNYAKEVNSNLPETKDYSIKFEDIKGEKPYDIVLSGNYDGGNSQIDLGGGGLPSGADLHLGSNLYRPPIIPDIGHTTGLSNQPILVNFPLPKPDISIPKPVISIPKPVLKPPPRPIVKPPPKPVLKPAPEKLVPLGILPKPLLNINGKLFFGAELGKNAGIGAGR